MRTEICFQGINSRKSPFISITNKAISLSLLTVLKEEKYSNATSSQNLINFKHLNVVKIKT